MTGMNHASRSCAWFLSVLSLVDGLTLNPLAPNVYWPGAPLPLSVNKILSSQSDTSVSYYDLPFVCQPRDGVSKTPFTVDEILRGDRIMSSDFDITMLVNDQCRVLCTKQLDASSIQKAHQFVKQKYRAEWYVDGLPGATSFVSHDKAFKYYSSGFNLGQIDAHGRTYLNNHFTFVIKYRHSDNHDDSRVILAFEVYPNSFQASLIGRKSSGQQRSSACEIEALGDSNSLPTLALIDEKKQLYTSLNVTYTYSVYFREDLDIHFTDRWNLYFYYSDTRIVWYTTTVSVIICLTLTAVVAFILSRTLSHEIRKVSKLPKSESERVDTTVNGWKALRDDVFRAPARGEELSTILGSGLQLVISLIGLLIRSKFPSLGLFVLLFAGVFAGYHTGRIYRSFIGGSESWLKNGLRTALRIPSIFLATFLVLDLFIWLQGSTAAIPLSLIVEMASMWLGVAVPLVLIGVYTGDRSGHIEDFKKSLGNFRAIPRQPFYTKFWPSVIIAGALPYTIICVELYFIMKSFQLHEEGYLSFIFGSLSLVFIIAITTAIEMTITMTYLVLQHEDHRWHWRAFCFGFASTGYIFVHAAFYFLTKLRYGLFSGLVYFGYMSIFCLLYGLVQGTLGYFASALFVHKIYGSIKTK